MLEVITTLAQEVKNSEKYFADNYYNGDKASKTGVNVIRGNLPVVLSAPHATTQKTVDEKLKNADMYTGAIGKVLQKHTDTSLIYRTSFIEDYSEFRKAYTDELKKLVSENNIKYVIDLHGAKDEWGFDVDLGTLNGISFNIETANTIIEIFKEHGLNATYNKIFKAMKPDTITNYAYNTLGIQAIQMEFSYSLRNPNASERKLEQLLSAMIEIVDFLNKNK